MDGPVLALIAVFSALIFVAALAVGIVIGIVRGDPACPSLPLWSMRCIKVALGSAAAVILSVTAIFIVGHP